MALTSDLAIAPRAAAAATLAEAFQLTVQDFPDRVALRTKEDEVLLTWAQYGDRVRRIAGGLSALDVGRGDTVALFLGSRPEFHLCDAAAAHLGATPFSVYNTYPAEQVAHLLDDSGANVLITERAMLETARAAAHQAGVDHLVVVDNAGVEDVTTLSELEGLSEDDFDFEAAWRAVTPDDLVTIIYTSGTTGPPKGVQLTHANVLATLRAYFEVVEFPDEGRVVSWLPMAHIAERACSHYLPIVRGYTTTCCPDPREVVAYLPEVRPTWFFAVPRVWEKLKAAIEAGIEADPESERRDAAKWAVATGLKRTRALQAGEQISAEDDLVYRKADELVLSSMRARLGLDEVRSVNVGAAPCPPGVIEFFHALGIPLAELYGMSESCGAGCVNPPDRVKIGTVGPPLPGVEARLAGASPASPGESVVGEILLRGPMVMSGYRNDPEKTREVIDGDGWLATGDIGEFDEDGYLRIVDRKKELIINAAGKNMSPANIEAAIKGANPLIGQAVAIGDNRPYNVALLVLDPDAAKVFAAKHGADPGDISGHPALAEAIEAGIEKANATLARVEQIKKWKLLPGEWQPGGDELTPTSKLKRKPIATKYAREIEALYAA
jgi:long-chain acyl-CoA synthetase